jgi:hypothetical protein
LVIDPVTPTTLYAGATPGGVFKSTNRGTSWSWIEFNPGGYLNTWVYALVIDPVTPSILYAGTGFGAFKSINSGLTWAAINTGLGGYGIAQVSSMVIDPVTPAILYAGTGSGMFISVNSGVNWSAINTGLTSTHVDALVIDPVTPTTLYAGTFMGGVFKTTNSGGQWTAVNNGLTDDIIYSLAIDPLTPTTLYAGTWMGGVFKTINGGDNWVPVNTGLPHDPDFTDDYLTAATLAINPQTDFTINALAIDPVSPASLYAATAGGGVYGFQMVPVLVSDHASGAPGSYFTFTGFDFPPDDTAAIEINGISLGSVPTDALGGLTFILLTSVTAEEGSYRVTATVSSGATTRFTLTAGDVVHPQNGTGTVFDLPDGIAYLNNFLPMLLK